MGSIEGDSRAFGISGIGVRAETPQASFIDSMGASAFVKILTANRDRRLVAGGDGVEWLGGEVARRIPCLGLGSAQSACQLHRAALFRAAGDISEARIVGRRRR